MYKENKGTDVRNFAIDKSNSEYIFFTDADCIVTKNWIEEGLNFLENNVVAVEGKTIAENQNFGASQHFVENIFGDQYQTCNIAYKKKLLECGMFNQNIKLLMRMLIWLLGKKNHQIKFNSI